MKMRHKSSRCRNQPDTKTSVILDDFGVYFCTQNHFIQKLLRLGPSENCDHGSSYDWRKCRPRLLFPYLTTAAKVAPKGCWVCTKTKTKNIQKLQVFCSISHFPRHRIVPEVGSGSNDSKFLETKQSTHPWNQLWIVVRHFAAMLVKMLKCSNRND